MAGSSEGFDRKTGSLLHHQQQPDHDRQQQYQGVEPQQQPNPQEREGTREETTRTDKPIPRKRSFKKK